MFSALIKVAGALVLGVPFAAYVWQDKLIFQPPPALGEAQRKAIAARHPEVADIFLQSADGARLHAWYVKAPPEAPLVLYFGGNAEDVSWMVEEIRAHAPGGESSAAWLLVDYRGYGASDGAPSEKALTADALAWYDRFASSTTRIYAFGRSLGSGVAVQLAAARRLDGVVLVAPFDSLVQVGKRHYPFLPVALLLKHRFDSIGRAPKIAAPLLCIVAAQDEVIPPEHARRLFGAWAGPKRWVELAGYHNEMDHQPDYWRNVGAFIAAR